MTHPDRDPRLPGRRLATFLLHTLTPKLRELEAVSTFDLLCVSLYPERSLRLR